MLRFEIGEATYLVEQSRGGRVVFTLIRPLPHKRNGRYDWDTEQRTLHKEIQKFTASCRVDYFYDPDFSLDLPPKSKVCHLCVKYYPYLQSLPLSDHVMVKPHMADKWGERELLKKVQDVDITKTQPSRVIHIGTTSLLALQEARAIYKRLAGSSDDAEAMLNVYQCSCGRNMVVPLGEPIPDRGFGSCGCMVHVINPNLSRSDTYRRLDALREWTTMVMACMDERSVYYDPANTFDIESFTDFMDWYDKAILHNPLAKRFVARKDPTQPFQIKNLKIVNREVDRYSKYGYTIL